MLQDTSLEAGVGFKCDSTFVCDPVCVDDGTTVWHVKASEPVPVDEIKSMLKKSLRFRGGAAPLVAPPFASIHPAVVVHAVTSSVPVSRGVDASKREACAMQRCKRKVLQAEEG